VLIVQKYGGSSVASVKLMRHIASRIADRKRKEGHQLVVVVSAMGDETDLLEVLARLAYKERQASRAAKREKDVLLSTGEQKSIALMALLLQEQGQSAVSLVGGQARIVTDDNYNNARIVKIQTERIQRELARGNIVVVAGFQGVTEDHEITTLGRGGSDLTAVALAAALKADICEIYTDVEGVFTADPSLVPTARKIDQISYDEMLELASAGAQVMQARSIEFAHNYHVKIHVRASHSLTPGTFIMSETEVKEKVVYRGLACDRDQAKFSLRGLPDVPGVAAGIFGRLGEAGINVDMIIQSAARGGRNDITFTVAKKDLDRVQDFVGQLVQEVEAAEGYDCDPDIAKITLVGAGMQTHPGVAGRMFKALAEQKINIELISTSETRISCVVKADRAEEGVRAVHEAFKLDQAGCEEGEKAA